MRKSIALLIACLLVCLAGLASAATVRPDASETLKALLGGKSFYASASGWASFGEGEDTSYFITITASEEDRFDASVIESLQAGDEIWFGNGTLTTLTKVTPDTEEPGFKMKGDNFETYLFTKREDGTYTARTDYDYPFWHDIFSVEVPLERDVRFLDWSDPENLEAPKELGRAELVGHLEDGTNFAPYKIRR